MHQAAKVRTARRTCCAVRTPAVAAPPQTLLPPRDEGHGRYIFERGPRPPQRAGKRTHPGSAAAPTRSSLRFRGPSPRRRPPPLAGKLLQQCVAWLALRRVTVYDPRPQALKAIGGKPGAAAHAQRSHARRHTPVPRPPQRPLSRAALKSLPRHRAVLQPQCLKCSLAGHGSETWGVTASRQIQKRLLLKFAVFGPQHGAEVSRGLSPR
jgi:hypothetical protein